MSLHVFVEILALSVPALSPPNVGAPLDPAVRELAIHGTGIAAALRAMVHVLKSDAVRTIPVLGAWARLSPRARVLLILALTALATAFDALALGKGWPAAVLAGLVGFFGAIGSHEAEVRVLPRKKKQEP